MVTDGQMGLLYEPAPFTSRILLPERSVGQRRIGREGVIFVAGLRGNAVLAAELERVEPLAVAGEAFLHAGLRIEAARLHSRPGVLCVVYFQGVYSAETTVSL